MTQTITVQISGLTCPACQKLIEKKISKIEGVLKVMVNLNGKTEITADKPILLEEIKKVLTGTQYQIV